MVGRAVKLVDLSSCAHRDTTVAAAPSKSSVEFCSRNIVFEAPQLLFLFRLASSKMTEPTAMLQTINASPCEPNTCAAPPVQRIGKQPLARYAAATTLQWPCGPDPPVLAIWEKAIRHCNRPPGVRLRSLFAAMTANRGCIGVPNTF